MHRLVSGRTYLCPECTGPNDQLVRLDPYCCGHVRGGPGPLVHAETAPDPDNPDLLHICHGLNMMIWARPYGTVLAVLKTVLLNEITRLNVQILNFSDFKFRLFKVQTPVC